MRVPCRVLLQKTLKYPKSYAIITNIKKHALDTFNFNRRKCREKEDISDN